MAISICRSAAAACFLLCAWSSARTEPLTLERAVELAIQRAPQIAANDAALESAQAEIVAAGRLPDPELVAGVDNLPTTGEDAWSFDRDFMTMRKIGLMQSFPNARKRGSQRERASAAELVVRAETQQTQLEVARATAEAWISVQTSKLVVDNLQQLKPEVQLQADAARAALASGRGTSVDALAAQSAITELDDRVLDAQRELAAARAELARWVGDDGGAEETGSALASAPNFRALPLARERILTSVHRHAPLLTFDAEVALANAEVELARASRRPDWSAELAYAKRGSMFSDMVSLEFRVGLPLFTGNRQDPMIRAKRAAVTQLEAQRETERRMHAAEVASMLAAWDAAVQRIELYEQERLPLARQRSRAALAGYQAGGTDLAAVLTSHVAEIELQRDYAELRKALGQAWAYLRYLEPGHVSP